MQVDDDHREEWLLPPEVWLHILFFTDLSTWGKAHRISRYFNELLTADWAYKQALVQFGQKWVTVTEGNQLHCMFVLANKKLHGTERRYLTVNNTYQLFWEQDWLWGKRYGQQVLYNVHSGNILHISDFRNDKKHGNVYQWTSRGNLLRVVGYANGKRHGVEAVMSPVHDGDNSDGSDADNESDILQEAERFITVYLDNNATTAGKNTSPQAVTIRKPSFVRITQFENGAVRGREYVWRRPQQSPSVLARLAANANSAGPPAKRHRCRYTDYGATDDSGTAIEDDGHSAEWPNGTGVCEEPEDLCQRFYRIAALRPSQLRRVPDEVARV